MCNVRVEHTIGMTSLCCCYWNIYGYKSKYLCDQLIGKEFLDLVNVIECDIIGLGEIQSEGKVDIPGFKCIDQKIRVKSFRVQRFQGGWGFT